jgi:hypothetical protein
VASLHQEKFMAPQGDHSEVTVTDAINDLPILRNGSMVDVRPYRSEPHSGYALKMRGSVGICGNHLVTKNAPYVIERFKKRSHWWQLVKYTDRANEELCRSKPLPYWYISTARSKETFCCNRQLS